jgi:hypothetical protein
MPKSFQHLLVRLDQARINKRPSLSIFSRSTCCAMALKTSLRWRHRFLRDCDDHRDARESGIGEADETFFRESLKGQRELPRPPRKRCGVGKTSDAGPDQIPVLVVRHRAGNTADFQLKKLDAAHLGTALMPLVDKKSMLCTDPGVKAGLCSSPARTEATIQLSKTAINRRMQAGLFIENPDTPGHPLDYRGNASHSGPRL